MRTSLGLTATASINSPLATETQWILTGVSMMGSYDDTRPLVDDVRSARSGTLPGGAFTVVGARSCSQANSAARRISRTRPARPCGMRGTPGAAPFSRFRTCAGLQPSSAATSLSERWVWYFTAREHTPFFRPRQALPTLQRAYPSLPPAFCVPSS